jgi:hypothetical protein
MRKPSNQDARLRMEARAKLADPSRPPNFIMVTVKPRWENGSIVQPPIRCDSWLARIGDRKIHRDSAESYEQFETRVASYLPVNGLSGYAIMEPTEDELPDKPAPTKA